MWLLVRRGSKNLIGCGYLFNCNLFKDSVLIIVCFPKLEVNNWLFIQTFETILLFQIIASMIHKRTLFYSSFKYWSCIFLSFLAMRFSVMINKQILAIILFWALATRVRSINIYVMNQILNKKEITERVNAFFHDPCDFPNTQISSNNTYISMAFLLDVVSYALKGYFSLWIFWSNSVRGKRTAWSSNVLILCALWADWPFGTASHTLVKCIQKPLFSHGYAYDSSDYSSPWTILSTKNRFICSGDSNVIEKRFKYTWERRWVFRWDISLNYFLQPRKGQE